MTARRGGPRLAPVLLAFGFLLATEASAASTPARWSPSAIQDLLAAVEGSEAEGLRPEDYGLSGLVAALVSGEQDMDQLADRAALALAHDLNDGAAPAAQRRDWHIDRPQTDYSAWLARALAAGDLRSSFATLLPTDPSYAQLKGALADCRMARRDCRIFEINLDRWRALPRALGARYVWVNVPAFRLDLVEDGRVVASHRVIVGKPSSRTPLFKAQVTGVTINPWWTVPCSIVDESIGRLLRTRPKEAARRGFIASRARNGTLVVRQKPGPENALGQVKLEMANPYSVYIHDTPTRELFARDSRALSHGCVRTEDPLILAEALLGPSRKPEIELLLLTGGTKVLPLATPIPVYVVYFTAELDPGKEGPLQIRDDIYQRDRTGL